MRTLVLVLSTLERPYPNLIRTQKRTWAARDVAEVDVLFYYGSSGTALHGRDLFLDVPDDHESIGHKTLACFEYVLAEREFGLVFRTNSSSYVDLPNLRDWVDTHAQPNRFYAGFPGGADGVRFASGSGYFLSRDLVEVTVSRKAEWDHGLLDDVALGRLLAEQGISVEPAPRVDLTDVWQTRNLDTSQFHFRCKTDSFRRRGDVDLLLAIDEAFTAARGERPARWFTPTRRLGTYVRVAGARSRRALAPAEARAQAARRVLRPPRPSVDDPERSASLGLTSHDSQFITGNGVAARCRYVLNYGELEVNEAVDNDWWFCKVDFLEHFFRELAPDRPFVLFSHNGDRSIRRWFAAYLRRRNLVACFAANVAFRHRKLFAIPLGIANPAWPHGDIAALEAAQNAPVAKERLFDVSFRVETNPRERLRCLAETGLELDPPRAFADHLARLASSYFCISPRGNGIDTHRTWEALYLGTVPVVTRSVLTDQHPHLPWVVLDDWSEFRSIDFSGDLYERVWNDFDRTQIGLDRYFDRIRGILA